MLSFFRREFGLTWRLRAVLRGLGRTEEEIVQTLRAAGVQGVKSDARICGLAVYIRQQMPGAEVFIGTDNSFVGRRSTLVEVSHEGHRTARRISGPLFRFVQDFDRGAFQDLVVDPIVHEVPAEMELVPA